MSDSLHTARTLQRRKPMKPSNPMRVESSVFFLEQTKDGIYYRWLHRRWKVRSIAASYGCSVHDVNAVLVERVERLERTVATLTRPPQPPGQARVIAFPKAA